MKARALGFQQLIASCDPYGASTAYGAFHGLLRPLAGITPEMTSAEAGAQFLVAPGLNPVLLDAAQRRGLVMLPGVFTATEIDLALRSGARALKLFPAEPSGPEHLASMLQPFPGARLVPTGGISALNAAAYLRAGAAALAMGSSLFPARRIADEGPEVVVPLIEKALAAIQEAG